MRFNQKYWRILAPLLLLVAVIVQSLDDANAQATVPFDLQRPNDQTIRLRWLPEIGDRILEQNSNLSDPRGWEVVPGIPQLVGDWMELDLTSDGGQQFYRFGGATIIFVDDSNAVEGTGTFEDPFQTLALATAEAATRFQQTAHDQVIYVFPWDYLESLLVRGTDIPGYQLKVIDSSFPLVFGGRIIGGGARATISPAESDPAIDVADVAAFSLYGFDVTDLRVVDADRLKIATTTMTSADRPTGINIVQADQCEVEITATVSNSTGSGIVIKESGGTFVFSQSSVTDAGGVGDAGVMIEDLAPDAQVQFHGSLTSNSGGDLINIDTTAAGSSVTFDGLGGDAITANGGGGIVVFDGDGDIDVNLPISITNARNGILLTGISLFSGSGVATFGATEITLTDNIGYNAGVEILGQMGAVSFASLNIATNDTTIGAVGLQVFNSKQVTVTGAGNTIHCIGSAAIEMSDVENFDLTFDEIQVSNTVNQAGKRHGIFISDTTAGSLEVTGTTTFTNLDGIGLFFNGAGGTFQFPRLDIDGTGGDALSLGVVESNPGTLTIGSGTFEDIGGDGVRAGSETRNTGGGTLRLDNVTFQNVNGITTDLANKSIYTGRKISELVAGFVRIDAHEF